MNYSSNRILVMFVLSVCSLGMTAQLANAAFFSGTNGDDFINGTLGDDFIDSLAGNDVNIGETIVGDGAGHRASDRGDVVDRADGFA